MNSRYMACHWHCVERWDYNLLYSPSLYFWCWELVLETPHCRLLFCFYIIVIYSGWSPVTILKTSFVYIILYTFQHNNDTSGPSPPFAQTQAILCIVCTAVDTIFRIATISSLGKPIKHYSTWWIRVPKILHQTPMTLVMTYTKFKIVKSHDTKITSLEIHRGWLTDSN